MKRLGNLNHNLAHACIVASRCVDNADLIAQLIEASEVLKAIDDAGRWCAMRDGNALIVQVPAHLLRSSGKKKRHAIK